MNSMESLLADIAPHWVMLAAVAASFLVNLALLGLILGRSDRRSLGLVKQVRRENQLGIEQLQSRLEKNETRHRQQMEELRRTLGRIELRQSHRLPNSGGSQVLPKQPRRSAIDRKHHVTTLARKGLDPGRIAQRLNMYRGEAELVLGLQQFMAAQAEDPRQDRSLQAAGAVIH